jgi:hypothetical protein
MITFFTYIFNIFLGISLVITHKLSPILYVMQDTFIFSASWCQRLDCSAIQVIGIHYLSHKQYGVDHMNLLISLNIIHPFIERTNPSHSFWVVMLCIAVVGLKPVVLHYPFWHIPCLCCKTTFISMTSCFVAFKYSLKPLCQVAMAK